MLSGWGKEMTSQTEGTKRGNYFIPHVVVQCLSIQSQGMRQINRKGEDEVGHSPGQWERSTVSNCPEWLQDMFWIVRARKEACSLPEVTCNSCLMFLASYLEDWKAWKRLAASLVLIMGFLFIFWDFSSLLWTYILQVNSLYHKSSAKDYSA